MTFRLTIPAMLILILCTGCTKPEARSIVANSQGADADAGDNPNLPGDPEGRNGVNGPGGSSDTASNPAPVVSEIPSEIQLANAKFTGEENKLEASVIFGGVTSSRLKLDSNSDGVLITVPSLPTDKTDTLVVEIYEDTTLRFVARRANTLVEKGKANTWALQDCAINKVPWSGDSNEGTCGWSIEESN